MSPRATSTPAGSIRTKLPTLDWWRGFGSPELTALMEEAQRVNLDIAAAVARFKQADALARQAGAALLPTPPGRRAGDLFPHLGLERQRAEHRRARGGELFGFAQRQLPARLLGPEPRRAAGRGRDRDRRPLRSRRHGAHHADQRRQRLFPGARLAGPDPDRRAQHRQCLAHPRCDQGAAQGRHRAPISTSRSRRALSPTRRRWCRRCGRRSTRTSTRWRCWCRGRRRACASPAARCVNCPRRG